MTASTDNTNTGNQTRQTKTRPVPAKARELLQDQANGLPVWIRPPKTGVEFYSGFSRAKLYEGAGKGHFRSVSIRAPGQVKGTRLFHLQSILDFIAKCESAAGGNNAENETVDVLFEGESNQDIWQITRGVLNQILTGQKVDLPDRIVARVKAKYVKGTVNA